MTSSPDAPRRRAQRSDDLPPALSSMWRLCKLGYRHEPRLMLAAFVLSQLAALPDALLALWLMLLGEGVLENRPGLVRAAAIGLGVSATATWFLRTVSTRVQRRFRDKVTIALESHVARLQASVATIAHHERPEYLDRLAMLRDQVFVLDHMYMSLFSTCGWILRLGVTVALLASIHPRSCCSPCSRCRPCSRRRGGPRSSAPLRSAAPRPTAWPVTCSRSRPRRRQERRCGSPASAIASWPSAARPGSAGTRRCRQPGGARRCGTRWRGRCSASRTSARWCSCRQASARRPATCCWCSPRDRACRRTSAPRSARSDSCAASGWTARGASPGSRTTPRLWPRRPICPCPPSLRQRHPPRARVVRLPGHLAPGPRRRVAVVARRLGRRHRRRERRRQDDTGQVVSRWRGVRLEVRLRARGCSGPPSAASNAGPTPSPCAISSGDGPHLRLASGSSERSRK